MARLSRKHRAAIARGVRRYWRRVKAESRSENISIRTARVRIKARRVEAERVERERKRPERRAPTWISPDPEGEFAFNLKDRNDMEPSPWSPGIPERFIGRSSVTATGYWIHWTENVRQPDKIEWQISFDPGGSEEEFWSNYFEAIREIRDDAMERIGGKEQYERLEIVVTSLD